MSTNAEKTVKKEKVVNCKFIDKWLNKISKKYVYYHEVITDEGAILSIGTMDKNSDRIKVGATIEYMFDDKGKVKLVSSSNDASKIAENVVKSKENAGSEFYRVKGQEAFLGYAWSYAKDLIIAGKTMKDVDELNNVARFIYDEMGKMLANEKK